MTDQPIQPIYTREPGFRALVAVETAERIMRAADKVLAEAAPGCLCATHADGSVTRFLCPAHADVDPCLTEAQVTGKRRKGTIRRGVCTACGWDERGPDAPNAAIAQVRHLLNGGIERTTTTTCSLVKDQGVSDDIATYARINVAEVVG